MKFVGRWINSIAGVSQDSRQFSAHLLQRTRNVDRTITFFCARVSNEWITELSAYFGPVTGQLWIGNDQLRSAHAPLSWCSSGRHAIRHVTRTEPPLISFRCRCATSQYYRRSSCPRGRHDGSLLWSLTWMLHGVDLGGWGSWLPWKYAGGDRVCLDPLKCHILSLKTVGGQLRVSRHQGKIFDFASKLKGKTDISRRLQADRNRDCWMFGNHWRVV